MRRSALIGTAVAVAALALSACGGGGSSAGGDAQSLIDTAYSVTSITVDGAEREVLGPVEVAFTADSISVATPCNGMSGPVTYSESTLTVGALAATCVTRAAKSSAGSSPTRSLRTRRGSWPARP